jgi:hypothetical protein
MRREIPAHRSGLTIRVWGIEELVNLLLDPNSISILFRPHHRQDHFGPPSSGNSLRMT